MGKRRKQTYASMQKWVHLAKVPLKISTHVFTVAGVIVASKPVLQGVKAASSGDFHGAANQIINDTTQGATTVTDGVKNAVVNVGIPLAVGIGLVWGGAQLRKRIGN